MTGRVTLVSGFLSNIFSIRSFMPGEIAGLKKQTNNAYFGSIYNPIRKTTCLIRPDLKSN